MQENGFKKEEMEKNTFDYREQDRTHSECKNIRSWYSNVESAYLCIYKKKFSYETLFTLTTSFVSGTVLGISLL